MLIKDMKILPSEENMYILYKYRPINKYTKGVIEKGELFFQKASEFNDPFDCFIDEIIDGNDEDWKNYLRGRNWNEEGIQKLLTSIHNNQFDCKKFLNKNRSQNNFYVSCFSKEFDNILMWSHYADCHRGFCVGYNVTHFCNSLTL